MAILLGLWLYAAGAMAQGMRFGMAGKRADDVNFVTAWNGCQAEAMMHGDTCVFIGESGPSHFRVQNKAIARAIAAGIDGLTVSVLNSRWLAGYALETAARKQIPVITFDSDLDVSHAHLRRAYVGMDNLAAGRQLGRVASVLRPGGGRVMIMTGGTHSTNLNQRIQGIRQVLSGNRQLADDARMDGRNGWIEHKWMQRPNLLRRMHRSREG